MTHCLGMERFLLKGISAAFGRSLPSSSSALRVAAKTAFHGQTQRLGVVTRHGRRRMAGLAKPRFSAVAGYGRWCQPRTKVAHGDVPERPALPQHLRSDPVVLLCLSSISPVPVLMGTAETCYL